MADESDSPSEVVILEIIVTFMNIRTALMSLRTDLEKWGLRFSINDESCSRREGGVHHCSDCSCIFVRSRNF